MVSVGAWVGLVLVLFDDLFSDEVEQDVKRLWLWLEVYLSEE